MRVILRHDDSGVSEVIGTILILAMTVVLFASIIIWVTSIPTPVAGTRLEIDAAFSPIYDGAGNEAGANITLRHQGGESLPFGSTNVKFAYGFTMAVCLKYSIIFGIALR